MRHVSAIGVALLGWVVVTAAPAGDARAAAKPAKPAAAQSARAHGKRVSAKGSPEAARHARRRGGSGGAAPDKASPGEVVGGLAGHKDVKARGKIAGKPGVPHKRVARAVPKPPCLHDPVEFERGFGGDVQSVVLTRCDGRPAPHAVEQISVLVRPMNA